MTKEKAQKSMQTDAEYQSTSERFEAVFENTQDIIVTTSAKGKIMSINPAIEKITGWTQGEITGKNFASIFHPDESEKAKNYFDKVMDGKTAAHYQSRLHAKNGKYIMAETIAGPLYENGLITGAFGIIRDLSERKKVLKLKTLQELQKREFLTMAAHELKTPLTPILLQSQMLEKGYLGKLSKQQKTSTQIITRNILRFNDLIKDMLEITSMQFKGLKLELRETQIQKILNETIENMRPIARKKHISITLKSKQLPKIIIAPDRIQQVLTNLVDNAIKFTPENGKINIDAIRDNENIVISVKDNGIGIDQADAKKLFDHFYHTGELSKKKYAGTGLGLTICKTIVELHEGKIWVNSNPNQGSTFSFTLPIIKKKGLKALNELEINGGIK